MSAIFLSTESQSPAAQMIIDCFIEIQHNMDIVSLDKYTDAISTISIIPFCVDEEFKNTFVLSSKRLRIWNAICPFRNGTRDTLSAWQNTLPFLNLWKSLSICVLLWKG